MVCINNENFVYFILIELNYSKKGIEGVKGVLLVDNYYYINELFKLDKEFCLIKRKIDNLVEIKENLLAAYRYTLKKTLRYLKQCKEERESLPITFDVQKRIVVQRFSKSIAKSRLDSHSSLDFLISDYLNICEEMNIDYNKKLEKRKKFRHEILLKAYFVEYAELMTFDDKRDNEELIQQYIEVMEEYSDFKMQLEDDRDGLEALSPQRGKTDPKNAEKGKHEHKNHCCGHHRHKHGHKGHQKPVIDASKGPIEVYSKVIMRGFLALFKFTKEENQQDPTKSSSFRINYYVLCLKCIAQGKNRKECKYIGRCNNWIKATISQTTKYFNRMFLYNSSTKFRTGYHFSASEIQKMISLSHCMVYDISLKQVTAHIRNYFKLKQAQAFPALFRTNFNTIMCNFFEHFFRRINFKDRGIFLYKHSTDTTPSNLSSINQYNHYLRHMLNGSKQDSFKLSMSYFLMVETCMMFKRKKNRKISFRNAQEFHRILIEKSLEDMGRQEGGSNCWLRFKNYFPRRKGDGKLDTYSCYKLKNLEMIRDFISNSGNLFNSITTKLSEIKVLESFQSLTSTYVSKKSEFSFFPKTQFFESIYLLNFFDL